MFGDGSIAEGVTTDLAVAAARAGSDDIDTAYRLGATGSRLAGEALYDDVRRATGAGGPAFVAETMVPRPSGENPPQNWQAPDAERLWETPIVGDRGTTVGQALVEMLEPDGQFIRQLDALGEGLSGSSGAFGLPVVGAWLSRRCCQAFHHGFVAPLARDPAPVLAGLLGGAGPAKVAALSGGFEGSGYGG